jgi:hypothetical protein
MERPEQKKPGRGGRREGAGRKPSGRSQIKIRIKTEIIEQLQPGAARKLSEFIEKRSKNQALKPSQKLLFLDASLFTSFPYAIRT